MISNNFDVLLVLYYIHVFHFLTPLLVMIWIFGRHQVSWSFCEPDLLPIAMTTKLLEVWDSHFNLAVLL